MRRRPFVTIVAIIALLAMFILPAFSVFAAGSWEQQELGTIQSLRAIVHTNGTLIAGGNTGNLIRSTDGGGTWSRVSSFASAWWHDLEVEPDGDVVAVGEGGSYAVSADSGVTWAPASLGVAVNLYDIERTAAYGYIVGDSGTVFYYSSNYNNWMTATTGVTDALYAVQDMGDGTAWMAGASGRLLRATQSALSFYNFGRVTADNIRGVYFTSSTAGWIVGEKGTFKRTTDGGTSWTSVAVSGLSAQDLFEIKASGERIVVVGDKIVIDSFDGGATWAATSFVDANIAFHAIAFGTDGSVWIVGTNDDVKSVVYRYETIPPLPEGGLGGEGDETEGSVEESAEAQPATLVKLACVGETDVNDPCRAVYFYASDGKRHAFPNEKVFFTWFDDFESVVEVSADFLSDLTLGANVTYHPGTRMVKFQSVPTVYAVSAHGVLRAIASETVAADLYGANWNQQIDDIPDAFWGNYSFGEAIDEAADYNVDDEEASVGGLDDNF